jgi:hypothetical protein
MSFANLKKQSSLGSLTSKLVKEVEKMNSKVVLEMTACGSPRWIKQVTGMLSSVSFLLPKGKICLGQRCTPMPSKVLVVGTSRTP